MEIANRAFSKDKYKRIKIIDLSNIHIINTPVDMLCKSVFWTGESYSLKLNANNGTFASVHFYGNDDYQHRLDEDYSKFFDNPLILGPSRTESHDGKNTNYYSTSRGDFKRIDYVIQKDNIKYVVIESYNLNMNDESLKCSDTIPSEVNIFYEANDCKCIIDIFEMESAPSDSWIADFVVKPYIGK